jgi:hypothetical protein
MKVQRAGYRQSGSQPEERLRKRIFALCREIGLDDEIRRSVAANCRRDGQPTMKGMNTMELGRMERILRQQAWQKKLEDRKRADAVRDERLRRHRRIDGDEGRYVSDRARFFLRKQAEILWGDDWTAKLHEFIKRQTGYHIFWDALTFPRDLHQKVTEGVLAMVRRAARDPSRSGTAAEINQRRRKAEEAQCGG